MWIRDIEVIAGGKKFVNTGRDAVDIEFDIPFSTEKEEPDVSEIYLYNLSNSSINQIRTDGYIYVNAGYKNLNNKGNILTGNIEDVLVEWEGVHKKVTILVSDGGKKWRNANYNKTYAAGTSASYIMRDLANVLSYDIVAIEPVNDIVFPRGYTVSGKAANSLKNLVKDTGSKMFINKNRLIIRDRNTGHNLEFILNHGTGLIESPVKEVEEEEDEKGNTKRTVRWRVTSLLNPLFEPDGIIRVESRVLNGRFRIVEGVHNTEFNTEMLVVEV